MSEKLCRGCNTVKALAHFHVDQGKADGRCSQCKVCVNARRKARYDADPAGNAARLRTWRETNRDHVRDHQRRYRLGITETREELDALLAAQGGLCAICRRSEDEVGTLHLDHSHTTGKARGFLCGPCNRGLGYLQDSIDVLRAAATYLEDTA